MINVPEVKLGIVTISRDCFPIELSKKRKDAVTKASSKKGCQLRKLRQLLKMKKMF
jgi:L-fucose isomerase-like protein